MMIIYPLSSTSLYLESNVARSVGVIAKLSYYLPLNVTVNLNYALVHTHLLHALPVWASTCKTYLNKLQRLQNKAKKIITITKIRERITPRYHQLDILKLDDLYKFETAKFMCLFSHNKQPDRYNNYFNYSSDASKYCTRQSNDGHIFLPRFTTTRTQRSIKFVGFKLWNGIPLEIKNLT